VNEEREPPSLQDTSERSALPLPLPDSDAGGDLGDPPSREERRRWRPLSRRLRQQAEEPAQSAEEEPASEQSTDETAAVAEAPEPAVAEEPEPEPPAPEPEPPAEEPPPAPAPEPEVDPTFVPPAAQAFAGAEPAGADGHPELLVGAAFLGGVALAFLVKRLGS
jgi:hypothetical protein